MSVATWGIDPPSPVPPCPPKMDERQHLAGVIARRASAYAEACGKSVRAAERRVHLPPGASRAAVTSANAKWSSAAEHRDRCLRDLQHALVVAGLVPKDTTP